MNVCSICADIFIFIIFLRATLDFMHDVGDTWCSASSSSRCVSSASFFTCLNRSLSMVGLCPTSPSVGACDCKYTPGAVQVSGSNPLTATRQRVSANSVIFPSPRCSVRTGTWKNAEGWGACARAEDDARCTTSCAGRVYGCMFVCVGACANKALDYDR